MCDRVWWVCHDDNGGDLPGGALPDGRGHVHRDPYRMHRFQAIQPTGSSRSEFLLRALDDREPAGPAARYKADRQTQPPDRQRARQLAGQRPRWSSTYDLNFDNRTTPTAHCWLANTGACAKAYSPIDAAVELSPEDSFPLPTFDLFARPSP